MTSKKSLYIWPSAALGSPHCSKRATSQSIADNTNETNTAPNDYGHDEVNHLRRRTCGWTQRLKPLPRARTRQTPRRTVMVAQHWEAHSCTWHHASCGRHFSSCTLRSTILHISVLRLRNCDCARGNPRKESQSHGTNLAAAQTGNHRLRRQHCTAHSCTFHHASCNSRFTCCTLSFRNRYNRERARCDFASLEKQQLSELLSSQTS